MDMASLQGRLSFILLSTVALQVLVSAWQQQWLPALFSLGIVTGTVAGLWLARRWGFYIPPGLQLMLVALAFSWLFLGYVHNYYGRFSWWDTVLHLFASAIISVMAFLLVHVFNKSDEFGSRTRPGLMALFTLVFTVAVGTFWEIFEFGMDLFLGANMQKAMLGDKSGLTDTMTDLVADTVGGLSVTFYGYYHLKKRSRTSFLKNWVDAFIRGNPKLFGRAH